MLPPIAAIAACGSLVTAVKSAWELRRMVKNKRQKRRDEDEALDILDELEDAYEDGLLTEVDYSRYYSRYLESVAEGDLTGLRKLRMHIDIVAVRQKMVPRSRSLEVARTQAQSATSRRGAPPSIPSPSQCSSSEAYSSAQSDMYHQYQHRPYAPHNPHASRLASQHPYHSTTSSRAGSRQVSPAPDPPTRSILRRVSRRVFVSDGSPTRSVTPSESFRSASPGRRSHVYVRESSSRYSSPEKSSRW